MFSRPVFDRICLICFHLSVRHRLAVSKCAFWLRKQSSAFLALLWASSIFKHVAPAHRGHNLCVLLSPKVRSLEQQNKLLETEIEALQNRFLKPTGLRMLYEEQLKELRRLADQMRKQRVCLIHLHKYFLSRPMPARTNMHRIINRPHTDSRVRHMSRLWLTHFAGV